MFISAHSLVNSDGRSCEYLEQGRCFFQNLLKMDVRGAICKNSSRKPLKDYYDCQQNKQHILVST